MSKILKVATWVILDNSKIAKKQTTTQQIQKIPFWKILKLQKPIKITHKPRQKLQPDHNTKKIP